MSDHPTIELYFDGGARGNPGPAGAGLVLRDAGGQSLLEAGYFLGTMTNNAAEYHALLKGLERAAALKPAHLTIYSDSELVVRQIQGQYRVKAAVLRPLYENARQHLAELANWSIQHVPRGRNEQADALANEAMDLGEDVINVDQCDSKRSGPPPVTAPPAEEAATPTWSVDLNGQSPCVAGCQPGQTYRFGPTTPAGLCVHAAEAVFQDGPLRWPNDQHTGETQCPTCRMRLRITRS